MGAGAVQRRGCSMREHKNTTTSAATPAVAKEPGPTFQSGPHSYSQSTTSTPPGQGLHIADLLSHGADHGLHLSDLVRLTGFPERTVRQMIHRERRKHIPILSNNKDGYYLPSSDYEKAECVCSLRRRAVEILEAADGIEGAAGIGK